MVEVKDSSPDILPVSSLELQAEPETAEAINPYSQFPKDVAALARKVGIKPAVLGVWGRSCYRGEDGSPDYGRITAVLNLKAGRLNGSGQKEV